MSLVECGPTQHLGGRVPEPLIKNPERYRPETCRPRARPPFYLILVARSEPSLYEYLRQRFRDDPKVEVVIDRRRGAARPSASPGQWSDRRGSGAWVVGIEQALAFRGVAVIRPGQVTAPAREQSTPNHHDREERRVMDFMDTLDDRQRVDRWLEESQYLIGRIIPGFLDDRDRLKAKLESTEQECDRLRQESAELRREIGVLQAEVQFFRNDHTAITEVFTGMVEHLTQLQKPLEEVQRRLQSHHAMSG